MNLKHNNRCKRECWCVYVTDWLPSTFPMHAGVASSLHWRGKTKCVRGKWLNDRIIVNDVKYLIEVRFKHLCASAWAFTGKHHLSTNKCVGNKCDRWGELWTTSINHGWPRFYNHPLCLFLCLFPPCFLLHSLSLYNMFPLLIKILPPISTRFSCCCYFLYGFASPGVFLAFFLCFT